MSGKNKTFSLCLARLDKSWSFMSNFFFTFQQMIDTSLENAPHQILLYKGQDVCVLYRSPNLWTNWDVIWHGGGLRGLEGSWGLTWYPPHPGYGVPLEHQLHFGKNKSCSAPLIQWGRVTCLGPKYGSGRSWAPCSSGAMVTHYEEEFIKSKLQYVPNSYLMKLDTPYPYPWVQEGQKGARCGSGASVVHFGKNFVKQKLLGLPNTVGLGHLLGPQILIQKDLSLVSFWSRGLSLSRRVYNSKVVVYVPNRYPLNSA